MTIAYLHGYSDDERARLRVQAATLARWVHRDLPFADRRRLLELGCGTGAQLELLLDAFPRLHATGVDHAEAQLPRFPKAPRWDRDPDFDTRVSALRTVRDAAAQRLDMDPGVLCSRDRLEAVARRNPGSLDEVGEVPELRRWQREELGAAFVAALAPHRKAGATAAAGSPQPRAKSKAQAEDDSPYRD